VEEILSLLMIIGILLGGICLVVRLVRRFVNRVDLEGLEAAKQALEREIARMKQHEGVTKG